MTQPLEAAELRIRETRAQLFATLAEVQSRLSPGALAQDALGSAASGVASVAKKGAEEVRKRPLALAAVAGGIGLVMARGWIGEIWSGRGKSDETGADAKRSMPEPAKGPGQ